MFNFLCGQQKDKPILYNIIGRDKNEQTKGERKGTVSKIKLSFRTSVHAKGNALLCLDCDISFERVQLWIMEIVQRSQGVRGLGVAYVFRQDQRRAQPLVQK